MMDEGNDDRSAVSRHIDDEAMVSESSIPLFPCTNKEGGVFILNSPIMPPVIEVESLPTNESPISYKTRTSEILLPSTPDNSRSPASGNADAWLAPGTVVWAKTNYHDWWPAEVVDEKVVQECSGSQHVGHVLVKMFGNNRRTWLDSAEHLSHFDHYREERSRNPLKAFQDALKQALCKHANTSPRIQSDGYSGEVKSPTPLEHSYDGGNTPSSSKPNGDSIEGGRGRRKRKLKIHYDELTLEEKPSRRLRRLRIMRNLGLVAPAGSPFSLSNGRSA